MASSSYPLTDIQISEYNTTTANAQFFYEFEIHSKQCVQIKKKNEIRFKYFICVHVKIASCLFYSMREKNESSRQTTIIFFTISCIFTLISFNVVKKSIYVWDPMLHMLCIKNDIRTGRQWRGNIILTGFHRMGFISTAVTCLDMNKLLLIFPVTICVYSITPSQKSINNRYLVLFAMRHEKVFKYTLAVFFFVRLTNLMQNVRVLRFELQLLNFVSDKFIKIAT